MSLPKELYPRSGLFRAPLSFPRGVALTKLLPEHLPGSPGSAQGCTRHPPAAAAAGAPPPCPKAASCLFLLSLAFQLPRLHFYLKPWSGSSEGNLVSVITRPRQGVGVRFVQVSGTSLLIPGPFLCPSSALWSKTCRPHQGHRPLLLASKTPPPRSQFRERPLPRWALD